jgi:actin related protein 2/3 complex, subunit 1A/1B
MSKKIFPTITAISFNKDGSQVALCAGGKEIFIYNTNGSKDYTKWERKYTLKEHTQKAAVIDWNHTTGYILTGSYDRSIFVWRYNEEYDKYVPDFVNMDEKLAILDLKWNNQGTKFVVGTSSKRIFVGFFDESTKWWKTDEIKKQHKSSVLSVEFSPNGRVIASASFDGTCKIISASNKDIDTEETKTPFGGIAHFGE